MTHANRGPDTGGWSGTEGLNMVQTQQLSKTKVVKKISYMGFISLRSQEIDNTCRCRAWLVRHVNFMVERPIEKHLRIQTVLVFPGFTVCSSKAWLNKRCKTEL